MAKYNEVLANKITALIADEMCSVSDICKTMGISRTIFYKWKRENPAFDEEVEAALEYRNETLLSMAYSGIRQRLERHTIVEEKDTYVPDETNPGKLVFKSRVIRRKDCLPDLRTIKMILDRQEKKTKTEEKEKDVKPREKLPKNEEKELPVELPVAREEEPVESIPNQMPSQPQAETQPATDNRDNKDNGNIFKGNEKEKAIKSIKDRVQVQNSRENKKRQGKQKYRLKASA